MYVSSILYFHLQDFDTSFTTNKDSDDKSFVIESVDDSIHLSTPPTQFDTLPRNRWVWPSKLVEKTFTGGTQTVKVFFLESFPLCSIICTQTNINAFFAEYMTVHMPRKYKDNEQNIIENVLPAPYIMVCVSKLQKPHLLIGIFYY